MRAASGRVPSAAGGSLGSLVLPLAAGALFVAITGALFQPAFPIGDAATVAPPTSARTLADGSAEGIRADAAFTETPVSTRVSGDVALPTDEISRMVQRGRNLVAAGDFAAARLLLQRAADAGDPDAVFALASTYDPNVLATLGARGLVGEPEQAKTLYARALAAGVHDAASRMAALGG